MSGMSAVVKGPVFDLFSRRAPGLSACLPRFVPALAEDSVAGETADDLVLTGGFLGADFFFCRERFFLFHSLRTISISFLLPS